MTHQDSRNVPAFEVGVPLTMSSREVAELTGKEHKHVLRDVRRMLSELDLSEEGYAQNWTDPQNGQVYIEIRLPRDLTYTLVAGYDVRMRKRIIDRWMELEEKARAAPSIDPMKVLNDPAAMRGLLLTYTEKVIGLEKEIATLAPKVAAHDRIAESFGSTCRRIAAKNLGVPPLVLNRWMMTNGWTYKHANGDTLAYQSKITTGYLEHKVDAGDKADGTIWTRTSVYITPKGLLALAKAFPPLLKTA